MSESLERTTDCPVPPERGGGSPEDAADSLADLGPLCWKDGGLPAELQRGMENLRVNRELTDVVLSVQGSDFPCHRAVLAAASQYFRYEVAVRRLPRAPARLLSCCRLQGDVLQRPEGEPRGARGPEGGGQRGDARAAGVHLHQPSPTHALQRPADTGSRLPVSGNFSLARRPDVTVTVAIVTL